MNEADGYLATFDLLGISTSRFRLCNVSQVKMTRFSDPQREVYVHLFFRPESMVFHIFLPIMMMDDALSTHPVVLSTLNFFAVKSKGLNDAISTHSQKLSGQGRSEREQRTELKERNQNPSIKKFVVRMFLYCKSFARKYLFYFIIQPIQ